MAASSVAPIATAPSAATVISVSIEKGVPVTRAAKARRPMAATPARVAAAKKTAAAGGKARPSSHAAASRAA